MLGRFPLALSVGVSWKDANLSNYLYGSRCGPRYDARGVRYKWAKKHHAYLGAT